jgi:hypothetical protein
MYNLTLNHQDGKLVLNENDIVFFLDETGHELLTDKNHPIFGIGGCGVSVGLYVKSIRPAWITLKKSFGFDEITPFHAADLDPKKMTKVQMDNLNSFWKKFEFLRVASITGDTSSFGNGAVPREVVYGSLKNRILSVIQPWQFGSITLCFESSDRLNDETVRNFHNFNLERGRVKVVVNQSFLPKNVCEPGMEIADFIMHSSGCQARITNKSDISKRRDFEAIWNSIDKKFMSYLFIKTAHQNNT